MHLRHREGVRRRPVRSVEARVFARPSFSGMAKRSYRHGSQSVCPSNVKFSQALAEDSPIRAREFIAGENAMTLATDILALDEYEREGTPQHDEHVRGVGIRGDSRHAVHASRAA